MMDIYLPWDFELLVLKRTQHYLGPYILALTLISAISYPHASQQALRESTGLKQVRKKREAVTTATKKGVCRELQEARNVGLSDAKRLQERNQLNTRYDPFKIPHFFENSNWIRQIWNVLERCFWNSGCGQWPKSAVSRCTFRPYFCHFLIR